MRLHQARIGPEGLASTAVGAVEPLRTKARLRPAGRAFRTGGLSVALKATDPLQCSTRTGSAETRCAQTFGGLFPPGSARFGCTNSPEYPPHRATHSTERALLRVWP